MIIRWDSTFYLKMLWWLNKDFRQRSYSLSTKFISRQHSIWLPLSIIISYSYCLKHPVILWKAIQKFHFEDDFIYIFFIRILMWPNEKVLWLVLKHVSSVLFISFIKWFMVLGRQSYHIFPLESCCILWLHHSVIKWSRQFVI